MTDSVVVIENMTKKFGEFTAVDKLSMTVERGRILGFIGPNGAGKTTTIKILVGLARPTSGTATIAGADCVTESHKIKKLVGYMPDKFGPYPNMRPLQRETQFVQFLESLDPDDAKLVVSIKDKKMPYKGITKGLFEEAWPALASTWVVQSDGKNN